MLSVAAVTAFNEAVRATLLQTVGPTFQTLLCKGSTACLKELMPCRCGDRLLRGGAAIHPADRRHHLPDAALQVRQSFSERTDAVPLQ